MKPILRSAGSKPTSGLIMDKVSRSILGYQVSASRDVGPCILTMRMAFSKFKEFPGKALKFIADGYSAYPLAAQQFKLEKDWDVFITQVIGLTNGDEVSKEFRPFKQLIERLNALLKNPTASPAVTVRKMAPATAYPSGSLTITSCARMRKTGGKEPLNKVESAGRRR